MNIISAQITCNQNEQIFKHIAVHPKWFNSPADIFSGITKTPDIVTIFQNNKKVRIFEISCAFDLFMDDSYYTKTSK